MSKNITIIGSGLAGMACAAYLAKEGNRVTVIEKNASYGGRLQSFKAKGFTFDSGPSWYWMPDLFDSFFSDFNKKTSDFYDLKRLDPSYRIYFSKKDFFDVPASLDLLKIKIEKMEKGSGNSLTRYLEDAEKKYQIATKKFMYKPSLSPLEYIRYDLVKHLGRLNIFKPISKHIRDYFSDPRIIQMLEFPGLFLGAKPSDTPALYSIMNYADLALGTWYPSGGIRSIADAVYEVALSQGVEFIFNESVHNIAVKDNKAENIILNNQIIKTDIVVANADYNHVESNLLEKKYRNYTDSYWQKRTMSPSALLFYVGIDKIVDLPHHALFFDTSFEGHANDIYKKPKWPEKPLFYVSNTSKSDSTVAPHGSESLFILIPVAPGLKDTDEVRWSYFDNIIDRIEKLTSQKISNNIVFKKSYAHKEFISEFNSFKGNAYGLANTLMQTAFLKPKIKNKKVSNLYYTGHLTVPGPGMPPALVSGKVVADQIKNDLS